MATPLLPAAQAQTRTVTVQVNQPGAAISPTMFGLFFEDINFAADGGIYPELVKNRSFEIADPLLGWKPLKGGANLDTYQVRDQQPVAAANPHYLRLQTKADARDEAGVLNEGFRGMGLKQGADLNAENSLQAPTSIVPVELPVTVVGHAVSYTLVPQSVTVLRVGGGAAVKSSSKKKS